MNKPLTKIQKKYVMPGFEGMEEEFDALIVQGKELVRKLKGERDMQDLKRGDFIVFHDLKEEVLARLEDLVWTQRITEKGGREPVSQAQEIEDLVNYGWKLESEI